MSTQRQDLAVREQFNFTPTTLKEAVEYATIFANSGLCPESYRGRPHDILIAWEMGSELGLGKMQALRTFGCINGTPYAYGDGLLALVKKHPKFAGMNEWFEGSLEKGDLTAFCTLKRTNDNPVTQKYSIEDAKRSGLWGKKGPWQTTPKRMLQRRARRYACCDAFPDAFFGMPDKEDAEMIAQAKESQPVIKGKGLQGLEETLDLKKDEDIVDAEIVTEEGEVIQQEASPSLDDLKELIKKTNTSGKTINLWLKSANVNRLEEFTEVQIQQAYDHLKNKEQQNGI